MSRRRLKAIRELWIRLDVWVAKGEATGTIDYPEARRRIEYTFTARNPENTKVLFKALEPEKKKRR